MDCSILWSKCNTHLVEWSTNEPPSKSLSLAKSTALTNGTAVSSSRSTSTENLYFFFFIMKAISLLRPGHRTLMPVACNVQISRICGKRGSRGSTPTVASNGFTSSRDLNFDSTTADDFDAFATDLQLPVVFPWLSLYALVNFISRFARARKFIPFSMMENIIDRERGGLGCVQSSPVPRIGIFPISWIKIAS